ncbi:acyl carrier protein [Roseateles sp. P5_E7]
MSLSDRKLKEVLARVLDVDVAEITEAASKDTLERWDSLRHMNLIMAIEEEFSVELSGDEVADSVNYQLIRIALKEHGVSFA